MLHGFYNSTLFRVFLPRKFLESVSLAFNKRLLVSSPVKWIEYFSRKVVKRNILCDDKNQHGEKNLCVCVVNLLVHKVGGIFFE